MIEIFCDFDGTITLVDSLQHLLTFYAGDAWHHIEKEVEKGLLDEKESLALEMEMLGGVSWGEALELVIRDVPLAPEFPRFVEWCGGRRVPLTVVSGGFRSLIVPILERHGLGDLTVLSNDVRVERRRWSVLPAGGESLCGRCNHCKSAHLAAASRRGARTVFIGNGLSDRCPAARADILFAKGVLAQHCRAEGICFVPFGTFDDVIAALEKTPAQRDP